MTAAPPWAGAEAALGRLLLAFDGLELPARMRDRLRSRPAAGVTLFRARNVGSADQVRHLVAEIQACAPPGMPFLVAVDQEGGQLRGLGPASTSFPSAMALGAVDDPDLTRRVAVATARELRAVGVTVNYAPVADLATNPANPALGIRSFGDDPDRVARHVAATVEGLVAGGVAATLKHFPGVGDVRDDPHHVLPTLDRPTPDLETRELVPFRAGIAAGAAIVMSAHVRLPQLTGADPVTLSRGALGDLLRGALGWTGVTVSDAFDMDALATGSGRADAAVRALDAGVDLVLLGGRSDREVVEAAIIRAASDGVLVGDRAAAALDRVIGLRAGLAPPPEPVAIDPGAHAGLAREAAERSITLVRDRDGRLPLRPDADDRILVVTPAVTDLTPADTTSLETGSLAAAIRRRHPLVDELVVAHVPSAEDISRAVAAADRAAFVIVGTASASLAPPQSELVRALLGVGRPAITVALRTPWDFGTYPEAGTHLCTFGVGEPTLEALAAVCFGEARPHGRLPVASAVAA